MEKLKVLAIGTSSDHMIRFVKYCDLQDDESVQIDVFLTGMNESVDVFKRESNVYGCKTPKIFNLLLRIPRISDVVQLHFQVASFRKLLSQNLYSLICIHQLKPYTLPITKIAKKKNIKVMLIPWGSDVLRATKKQKRDLQKAFNIADYVSNNFRLDFTKKIVQIFKVSPVKLVDTGYGSEVISSVYEQKLNSNKNAIAKEFGMSEDRYYITCGYAANRAQRHVNMIEAIGKNKSLFPQKPLLIFPFTYGPDKMNDYQSEIVDCCSQYQLDYFFVKDYLSNEKMARLRLLSDLFFQILPTDACSASMVEYILAGSICVVGKWLDYKSLEEHGAPYYICEKLSDLPNLVGNIYKQTNPNINVSEETKQYILSSSWQYIIQKWYRFFHAYSNEIQKHS